SSGFKELDGGGNTGFEKSEVMAKARIGTDPASDVYHRLDVKAGWADELSNETYLGLSQADFDATPFRRYAASRLARMEWERTQIEASYGLWLGDSFEARLTAYRHDFTRAWFKLNRFGDGGDVNQVLDAENELLLGVLRGERSSNEAGEVTSPAAPGLLRIGTNDRTFVSQGVQLDGRWKLDHGDRFGQDIRFGARLHYDEVARDHTEDIFEMATSGDLRGDLVRTSFDRETTLFNRDEALAFSAYAQDEIRLFERLRVSPGGRIEVISTRSQQRSVANDPTSSDVVRERTQTVVVPGIGIYYQLFEAVGLLAGAHRGFSPVGPGNSDAVEPELSWNFEAGARFQAGRSSGEILGFFNDYANLLVTCSFSQGCEDSEQGRQFNGGSVWVYGLEALGHHEFSLPAQTILSLDARYTLTLSEFRTAFSAGNPQFQEVLEGDRLPYVPEHQGNLSARVSAPLGPVLASVTLSYTFVDRMRDFASQGDVGDLRQTRIPKVLERDDFTDAQHVVDASLQVDVTDQNRIYLRIDNLFDQTYVASRRPFGARPGRPFTAQIGYTHRFGD
ncbi:MAG: TonB-dependent receptor, partial [Myxococcota bacterium]